MHIVTNTSHVIDVLGNVVGRDQPIMLMEKAFELVSQINRDDFIENNIVFFDPFCKAGEILFACAFYSCFFKTLNNNRSLDLDFIKNEIYNSNRYFGLSPDERHHKLSLRTFLGNTRSHDEKFNKIIRDGHYLSEDDGTLDKNKYMKELISMIEFIKKDNKNKKIIAIGNPPYQENYKGNGKNPGSKPIYHIFLEALIDTKMIDQFLMVIPSRWFAGGRGKSLKNFALTMRQSKHIKQIYDFPNAKCVFPTVDIKGGVCFLHWDMNYNGDTLFYSSEEKGAELVDLTIGNLIIRDASARPIVEKITRKALPSITERAWSWNPFNIASNYFEINKKDVAGNDSLECLTKRGIFKKISKTKITKNTDKINLFKVIVPKAVSTGGVPYRPNQVLILNPHQICNETFMVIDTFRTYKEAQNFLEYITSDIARFLISVKKITQDITKETWCLVPDISSLKINLNNLYEFFELNEEEINYINKKVKEWA